LTLWRKYTDKIFIKLDNPDQEFFESGSSSDSKENDLSFNISSGSSSSSSDEKNLESHKKKNFVSEMPTPMKISINLVKKQNNCETFVTKETSFVLPNGVYEEKL